MRTLRLKSLQNLEQLKNKQRLELCQVLLLLLFFIVVIIIIIIFFFEKLFCRKYFISFILAFQEHLKCVFKASRKNKHWIWSFLSNIIIKTTLVTSKLFYNYFTRRATMILANFK